MSVNLRKQVEKMRRTASEILRDLEIRVARLERVADTSLTHEVNRRILQELNKYTGNEFNNSFSQISIVKRVL